MVLVHKHSQPIAFHLATQLSLYLETCHTEDVQTKWAGLHNVANGNNVSVCLCVVFLGFFMCLHSLAYLLIIGLQDMVEPGDLSQFAQFSLHTLQGCGQLLLLWWVQLLQEGTHKYKVDDICMSNTMYVKHNVA